MVQAFAANAAGKPLEAFSYDPGPLGPEEVTIEVEHCGICHSDLSVVDNEWGISRYPVVPGHEVIGRVSALGAAAKGLKVGQRVGVGWYSGSCMHCDQCVGGSHHLCPGGQATIVGHHGGFGSHTRAHWTWAIPLPEGLNPASAGPLLCGGMTVFSPLLNFGVKPTSRVGVVGIGGLGHMALMFARAWGCEVTAFSSTPGKTEELLKLGAHRVVNSRDPAQLRAIAGTLDLIIVTVNVSLDWEGYVQALAPRGRLHVVGAVLEPIPVSAFALIVGEKHVSGSPTGSPGNLREMLRFAARHKIEPVVQRFPMSKVNEALQHLRDGKARYRVVLDAGK
jgi:uncharacterized zinc-type alcohol dehydrogenase-like protein